MRGKLRWKRSTAWLCLGAWLGLISAVATAAPASIFDLNQGAITYTVVVVGQLNYLDKYGGGGDTGRYIVLHRWMGIGTATIFTAAGLLAVLARALCRSRCGSTPPRCTRWP